MASWFAMRKKLETEYLAESLRGRISYFTTRYTKAHDQMGRAAILLDGKEVLKGCCYNYYKNEHMVDEYHRQKRWGICDGMNLAAGMLDGPDLYNAYYIYDNQSVEKSLCSENMLVRIWAVLDRRVGKRRLVAMADAMSNEHEILRFFYRVRMEAEGLEKYIEAE